MTLQDKLDDFRIAFESGEPPYNISPDVVALMHRATKELQETGQANRTLKVGDRLPDFDLPDAEGRMVRSSELLKDGPLVISFYRGVWCPYCNMELDALQAALGDIREKGAHLVSISPQTPTNSRKSARQNNVEFPILSDGANTYARQLGLVFRLPEYLIEGAYKKLGAILPTFNGDDSWELPMPARFVADTDGTIAYAEVNPDYTQRPDPSELLDVLDTLNRRRAA
ncbi:MAG: peroxiredoxin-like family protein [Pseudomonadota bacterium]